MSYGPKRNDNSQRAFVCILFEAEVGGLMHSLSIKNFHVSGNLEISSLCYSHDITGYDNESLK